MSVDLDSLLAQAKAAAPSPNQHLARAAQEDLQAAGWARPVQLAPGEDPFAGAPARHPGTPAPWDQWWPPVPPPAEPGPWLRQAFNDMAGRISKGSALLSQDELPEEEQQRYAAALGKRFLQLDLLKLACNILIDCPRSWCSGHAACPRHGESDRMGRYRAWTMAEGRPEVELVTPGGTTWYLVPWPSGQDRPELLPADVAALSRVAALTGLAEGQILDLKVVAG